MFLTDVQFQHKLRETGLAHSMLHFKIFMSLSPGFIKTFHFTLIYIGSAKVLTPKDFPEVIITLINLIQNYDLFQLLKL